MKLVLLVFILIIFYFFYFIFFIYFFVFLFFLKTTLSSKLLKMTGTLKVTAESDNSLYLDKLQVEKERGFKK